MSRCFSIRKPFSSFCVFCSYSVIAYANIIHLEEAAHADGQMTLLGVSTFMLVR